MPCGPLQVTRQSMLIWAYPVLSVNPCSSADAIHGPYNTKGQPSELNSAYTRAQYTVLPSTIISRDVTS